MELEDIFAYSVDPDTISVYIGRVVKLDEHFSSNGVLYVDVESPDETDLDLGSRQSVKALASYAVRSCFNAWSNPPEIKARANFSGSCSFTSSGDFHLRNYCFDMVTQTWFMTVSTALNALGIVNVPPVMVGLDTTPFPGQAVSINIASSAKETVEESIESSLNSLQTDGSIKDIPNIVPLDDVKKALQPSTNSKFTKSPSHYDGNDPVIKTIQSIIDPLQAVLEDSIGNILKFLDCIKLILDLYSRSLDNIEEITIPITQYSVITDGVPSIHSTLNNLAIKTDIEAKIELFKEEVNSNLSSLLSSLSDTLIEKVYNPIAYLFSIVNTKLIDIIDPIKIKIKNLILSYTKEPLSQLISYIAMAIQPVVSSLPTVVQLVVKLALKKLLQVIVGKPIQYILKTVIEPIDTIIDKAIDKIQSLVGELINTSITTIINPLIKPIQTAIASLIPSFDINEIKEKLERILSNIEEFPKIYIKNNPIKPYKDFDEINWSDPDELSAMIISLIGEVSQGHPVTNVIQAQDSEDSIFKYKKTLTDSTVIIGIQGSVLENQGDSIELKDMPIIPNQGILKEGTINTDVTSLAEDYTNGELNYRYFPSKEAFLPYFIKVHPPIKDLQIIGVSPMFKDITSSIWVTNYVPYVVVDIDGEKKRFLCGSHIERGIISTPVDVRISDTVVVTLDPDKLYETKTIQHIPVDADDPPVGEDLIPIVDEYNNPIPLSLQRIVDGELVYLDNGEVLNFSQIASKYYTPNKNSLYSEDEIVKDLITLLNSTEYTEESIKIKIKQSLLYKLLDIEHAENKPYTYILHREESTPSVQIKDYKVKTPYFPDNDFNNQCLVNIINNTVIITLISKDTVELSSIPILEEDQTELKVIVSLQYNQTTGTYTKLGLGYQTQRQIQVLNNYSTYWDNTSKVTLSYMVNTPDVSSAEYYSWMVSKLNSNSISVTGNDEEVENVLINMFQQTVSAIGQSEGFNAKALVNSLVNKAFSPINTITDTIPQVETKVQSTLERVDELKDIDSIVDSIAKVGEKIREVSETAGPALEATAKAASSVALQSCSMTQSASGKDFSFTSGDSYDLSTITESRSQLPWCRELDREQFLEPNCKVLLLAVGAGKRNLYVIDILS